MHHHTPSSSSKKPIEPSTLVSPFKAFLSIMAVGFFIVALASISSEDFHIKKEYGHERAIRAHNQQKQETNKLLHILKEQQKLKPNYHGRKEDEKKKEVWEEYSFSNSHDKEQLHPNLHKNNEKEFDTISNEEFQKQQHFEYIFELDKPREKDEELFFHRPKSQGGKLLPLPSEPSSSSSSRDEIHQKHPSSSDSNNDGHEDPIWTNETYVCARHLHRMFTMYDEDETADDVIAVYGTMCVGKDCEFIIPMIQNIDIPLGHFIVVLSSAIPRFVHLFSALMKQFPGRFSVFHRPQKLSCAESWNLVTRMGFAHVKPMPDQIFIANADWHPRASNGITRHLSRFMKYSRKNLNNVLNRYMHFSSFAFTRKGYLELGYFDEVIYPALAEDVEFHLKAVSKGLGTLGLYDFWKNSSRHIHRASAGEKTIQKRHGSVARFDYILRKWGIRVPQFRDFLKAPAFRHPFNLPWMHHNNSWVVDPEHRKCAKTGDGVKMENTNRCYYDANVLMKLFPEQGVAVESKSLMEKGAGDIIGVDSLNHKKIVKKEEYVLPKILTTRRDSFPGPYH